MITKRIVYVKLVLRSLTSIHPFLLDIIDVIKSPIPNPMSIDPTKLRGDVCKKKNPTPIPSITPPPIAQVLLSFFVFVIVFSFY